MPNRRAIALWRRSRKPLLLQPNSISPTIRADCANHNRGVLRGADVIHASEGYIKRVSRWRLSGATLDCMVTDHQLSELVALVARWALGAKYRVVTAESCTGGWIAKAFTDAAGSSRWFESGYVTYSNAAKARDLGVSERTLQEHGAVSEPAVREMAAGALRATGADVSIAVSGIAGPDGGSAEKPVGTVWFCVGRRVSSAGLRDAGGGVRSASSGATSPGPAAGANAVVEPRAAVGSKAAGPNAAGPNAAAGPEIELISEGEVFAGDREAVRRASVRRALELVLRFEKPA
jgi:nicotinamide-nucleotide amidase